MKKHILGVFALTSACVTLAQASQSRCAAYNTQAMALPVTMAYQALSWATKCSKGRSAAHNAVIQMYWTMVNGEAASKNGTYFPPEGSPDYERVRDFFNFPNFFIGATLEAWQGYRNPALFARIAAGDCSVEVPAQFNEMEMCVSGCYSGDQMLLFASDKGTQPSDGKWYRMDEATDRETHVITLSSAATLQNLKFTSTPIDYFIKDPQPIKQSLMTFKMESGGMLKVTRNHPIVDSAGVMRVARDLKVGEKLVRQDGSFDAISAVNDEAYFGQVYNLDTKSKENMEKVVIANGYLNGTHFYQSLGKPLIDRVIVRSSIAAELEN